MNCINCEKRITAKAIRCWECYIEWRKNPKNHPNYKNGRSLKKNNCIDCRKEIVTEAKRCGSCGAKYKLKDSKNHPRFIKGITKKLLIKEYIKKEKSITKVAKKLGYSRDAIRERLIRYNIPIRTISEALKKLLKNPKNHSNWQGGISFEEYGQDFDNALKEQVRFRDKYKCQECGCSQVENSRQLDVHHINYNKKDLNFNNLISLCKSCHMKTNFNRTYYKKYFKELIYGTIF